MLLSALALTTLSLTGASAQYEKALHRVTWVKGDVLELVAKVAITGGAEFGSLSFTMVTKQTCMGMEGTDFKLKMSAQTKEVVGSGPVAGAKDAFAINIPLANLIVTPLGDTRRLSAQGITTTLQGSSNLVFPKAPISQGDSWLGKVELGGTGYSIRYTYDGIDFGFGKPLSRYSGRYVDTAVFKHHKPIVFLLDPTNNLPVRVTGDVEISTPNAPTLRLSLDIRRSLFKQKKK